MGYGMTIPFQTLDLADHPDAVRELQDLGYSDLWTSEAQDLDGFLPLALASQWAPEMRLGCAVFPVQTRGPAVFAMSAATLALAAPGRCVLGIGSSSDYIVRWQNARPFVKPLAATRDMARFLRAALAGEKVDEEYESFRVRGFKLRRKLDPAPPVLIAGLRPKMLDLAGQEGDGVILNYVTPEDIKKSAPLVKKHGEHKEIAGRVYVCPTTEKTDFVRTVARHSIAGYFNVPTYRAHQEWLGNHAHYQAMWDAWDAGDRKGALAALTDEAVDRHYIHGPAEYCRERIDAMVEAGLETPIIGLVEEAMDPREAVRLLAPGR